MTNQKLLSEFKEFCKQNILQDLFRLERERKEVLVSVIISSVIFLLIITFISQLFIIKIPDLDYFTFIYSGDMSVSLSAFLLTRLFRAKFNKFAKFITIIQPKILKVNVNSINHGDKQLVKLEDSEFAKYFTVYSEDQVNARYILSTNLMEKLVDFRQKVNKNIYASFVDDTIYFAIEYADGLFEANLYRSMLSFTPLREYFEAIQLMLGLVEELNLDREIWKSDDV
jgi:Protein of unknown function (DUF3137)